MITTLRPSFGILACDAKIMLCRHNGSSRPKLQFWVGTLKVVIKHRVKESDPAENVFSPHHNPRTVWIQYSFCSSPSIKGEALTLHSGL